VTYQDRTDQIAQANNALLFPGLGLGVTVAKARRISDGLIAAAAAAADEGLAQVELPDLIQQVHDTMWRPAFPHIERHPG